jgi:hypothetical protein
MLTSNLDVIPPIELKPSIQCTGSWWIYDLGYKSRFSELTSLCSRFLFTFGAVGKRTSITKPGRPRTPRRKTDQVTAVYTTIQ